MTKEPEISPLVGDVLAYAEGMLAEAGSRSARQDAIELLGAVLGDAPATLLAHPERQMTVAAAHTYGQWIADRRAGIAIPHITGHLAFMGFNLQVAPNTPLPPPYAARLIEVALLCVRLSDPVGVTVTAAELGTGCGAAAVALAALEPRFTRIYAVDPVPASLQTASANGERYLLNLVISWLDGVGMEVIPEPVDVLLRAACWHTDSPEFLELAQRAPAMVRPGGAVICGLDAEEEVAATDVLKRAFPTADVWVDAQSDGVVVVAQTPRTS